MADNPFAQFVETDESENPFAKFTQTNAVATAEPPAPAVSPATQPAPIPPKFDVGSAQLPYVDSKGNKIPPPGESPSISSRSPSTWERFRVSGVGQRIFGAPPAEKQIQEKQGFYQPNVADALAAGVPFLLGDVVKGVPAATITAKMAYDTIMGLPGQYDAIKQAVRRGDTTGAIRAGTELGMSAGFIMAGLHGAVAKGEPNASENAKTAEIHGNVRPQQPPPGELPQPEGVGGIQPQAEGRVPEAKKGEVLLTPRERRAAEEMAQDRIDNKDEGELGITLQQQQEHLDQIKRAHADIRKEIDEAVGSGEKLRLQRELRELEMELRELAVGKRAKSTITVGAPQDIQPPSGPLARALSTKPTEEKAPGVQGAGLENLTPAKPAVTGKPDVIGVAVKNPSDGKWYTGPDHPTVRRALGLPETAKEERNTPDYGYVVRNSDGSTKILTRPEYEAWAKENGLEVLPPETPGQPHSDDVKKASGKILSEQPKKVEGVPPGTETPEGTVRIYRGHDGSTGGVYWTEDQTYAAKMGPKMEYMDVPKSELQKYSVREVEGSGTPNAYKVPPDWTKNAKPVEEPPKAPVVDLEKEPAKNAVEQIKNLPTKEFFDATRAWKGGLTGKAYELGRGVTSQAEADSLKAAWDEMSAGAKKAIAAKDLEAAQPHAMKAQFFREAYEAATGTGSAGEYLKKSDPTYKPPFPITAEKPVAPAAPEIDRQNKQPWEKTRDEWRQGGNRATWPKRDAYHREQVEKALAFGKPVPESVLADYPDLRNRAIKNIEPVTPEALQKIHHKFVKTRPEAGKPISAPAANVPEPVAPAASQSGYQYPLGQTVKFFWPEGGSAEGVIRGQSDDGYRIKLQVNGVDHPVWVSERQIPDQPGIEPFTQPQAPATPEVAKPAGATPVEEAVGLGGAKLGETPEKTELGQLSDSLKTLAESKKRPALNEAYNLGERWRAAKDRATAALNGLKAAWQYARIRLEGLPIWTSFKDALGDRQLAISESTLNARKYYKTALRAIQAPVVREAIANYVDAGGDKAILRQALAETKPRYRAGYKRALRLTPEEKVVAENIKNYFESRLQDAIDAGILEEGIEDYIHRMYEADSPWKQGVLAELRAGVFTGKPSLAKQRVFQYDFEAEKAGYAPVKDFARRVSSYDLSLNKAIADREMVRKLMQRKMDDGLPEIATSGMGTRLPGVGADSAFLVKPFFRGGAPVTKDGRPYVPFDHPALRKFKWIGEDSEGTPIIMQGEALVHPDGIKEMTAVFGRSKIRQSAIGRAAFGTSSVMKMTMLDLSMFHPTQITVHGWEHKTFRPIEEINLSDPTQRALVKHGLVVADPYSAQMFSEGLGGTGGSLTRHLPYLGSRLVQYNHWLFQDYIPRLKMAMGLHALERNRVRYAKELASGKMTEDQLYHLTANQANAAFGEQNYEMLGRNKTVQDALRLGLLAPDFLEARGRFVGQAFTKYGGEQRAALLLGASVLYITARLLNKMLDGQYHFEERNAFSVVVGKKSYSLRTVQGDLLHMVTDPAKFTYSRLNPVYGRTMFEAITRRDPFGRTRTPKQQAYDFIKTAVPITFRGLIDKREQTLMESFFNAMGITERRDTANDEIYRLAGKWKQAHGVGQPGEFIYDPDKDPYRRIKLALVFSKPEAAAQELALAVKNGAITFPQAAKYFSRFGRTPFTGSKANDRAFYNSLDEDQKATYKNAVEERKKIGQNIREAFRIYREHFAPVRP